MLTIGFAWLHGSFLCCAVVGVSTGDVFEAGKDLVSRSRFTFSRVFRFAMPCAVQLRVTGWRAYPSHVLPLLMHFLQTGD